MTGVTLLAHVQRARLSEKFTRNCHAQTTRVCADSSTRRSLRFLLHIALRLLAIYTSPLADSFAASSLQPFWSDSDVSAPSRAPIEGPVYSYSVIPGGVLSAKELEIALRHDPMAAAHYADFHVELSRLAVPESLNRPSRSSLLIGKRNLQRDVKLAFPMKPTFLNHIQQMQLESFSWIRPQN